MDEKKDSAEKKAAESKEKKDAAEKKAAEGVSSRVAIVKNGVTRIKEKTEIEPYLKSGWVVK